MRSETIEITTADGTAETYVARPDDGVHPGVLLYMDAIGLRPRIEEMADRIASWGYVVLAPNLFYRSGSADDIAPKADLRIPANREAFFAGVMPLVRGFTTEQSMADTDSYLKALSGMSHVKGAQVGVTGYCMGGRHAFVAACTYPDRIAASGSFHAGGLVGAGEDSPHLHAADASAELYFGHADNDRSMPAEAIATFDAALADSGLTYSSHVYKGAAHGYTMADTSSYDEAATERHFDALADLFARNLNGTD